LQNGIEANEQQGTKSLKQVLRDYFFVLVFGAISLAAQLIPLQRYISIARYEHYGLSIFLFGLGCVLHMIWKWPRVRPWSRAFYACTGIFICSVGLVLYSNPWLDTKTSVINEARADLRALIIGGYVLSALALVLIGYLSWKDDQEHREKSTLN
jgi:hypothetical protein